MKNCLMLLRGKIMPGKRIIIEFDKDQFKNIYPINHTCSGRMDGFVINWL